VTRFALFLATLAVVIGVFGIDRLVSPQAASGGVFVYVLLAAAVFIIVTDLRSGR